MRRRHFILGTAGMAGAGLILPGATGRALAQGAQQVTYLLPAPAFLPAFGPWMLAQARGYYADSGLDVSFQTAQGGVDVATQVGAGNAVIGGAIGDTPVIVRANRIPVRAVAVLGGRSLTQITAMADSRITGPADLAGKTVTTLSYQDTTYYALLAALASVGLTRDDVNIQAAGPAGVWQLFLAGEADAMAAVPDWIGLVQAQGHAVNIMPVEDYAPSMAQAILSSDEAIAEQPEVVGALVRATLQGLSDIMEDPAGAAVDYAAHIAQHADNVAGIEHVFRLYGEYVYPGQQVLGAMDPDRLSQVQDFYVDQQIVRRRTPLEELYTNQFVG